MADGLVVREFPETIGPFRLVRVLGEGAMGRVYLGERMEMFTQQVAIKVLRPEMVVAGGEGVLEREEAILTSLDHPAIVRLLDKGTQGVGIGGEALRYIVMEYVEGRDLEQYRVEAKPGREVGLGLLVGILRAVEYAHRRLVIHADLKPGNILVMADGLPKVLDFGIATLVDPLAEKGAMGTGGFTREYASPEQIAGGRVTPACDIYSMGVLGSLLLSGSTVPKGEVLGADLLAILRKATRPEPEERYRSAGDFADELEAVLAHRPVGARRGGAAYRARKWMRRHRAAAVVVAAVGLVLVGSVAGVAVESARAERERAVTESRLRDLVRLTGELDGELYGSVQGLARAEGARATLLQGATGTLDKLAAEGTRDPVLAVEMAKQYEQLGKLEAGAGNRGAAARDLERGLGVLGGVKGAAVEAERGRVVGLREGLGR